MECRTLDPAVIRARFPTYGEDLVRVAEVGFPRTGRDDDRGRRLAIGAVEGNSTAVLARAERVS